MKDKLIIKECSIINNLLHIRIVCDVKYNPDIFEPQLKIRFDDLEDDLLLPVSNKNRRYLPFKDLDHLEFEQKYPINLLFLNKKSEKINFSLGLTYGELFIEDFVFQGEININNFNSQYIVQYKEDNKDISLIKDPNKSNSYNIKNILSFVIRIPALIISIFLIPFFIVEAFFIVAKIPKLLSSGGLLYLEDPNPIKRGIRHVLWRISRFSNLSIEESFVDFKDYLLSKFYNFAVKIYKKENTVMFISERGNELTGNLKFVNDYLLKNEKDIKIKVSTINQSFPITSFKHKWSTYKDMTKSSVILLDNYFTPVNILNFNHQTLIQLWHACGAFKTFGFSRFGRPGGPKLFEEAHRKYDMALVSSTSVVDCYSEAYAMSSDKVLPLGIPRTDIFFDEKYIESVRDNFYKKYPQLKEKKIILFGPTFRGNSRRTGYYPTENFDPVEIYNQLNQEYAIIIKRHFFINDKFDIPEEYREFIMDLDVSEDINDLLFITDILITDYSSTVFEASLLDIPMIFYAFDLDNYISERSFYFEYKNFVPGKITYNQNQLIDSIKNRDFEKYKIREFRDKFFDDTDGKSTERVVDYILDCFKD